MRPRVTVLLLLFLAVSLGACRAYSPQSNVATDRQLTTQAAPEVTQTPVPGAQKPVLVDTEWLIEPGKSAGKITNKSTLADLQRMFGKENVRAGQVHVGEGQAMPGAVIFPKAPERKAEIIWKEGGKTAANFRVSGEKSLWHTAEGITLGTTLKELEKLNGGPFTLAGFGWDYSGTVLSWGDKGRLRKRFQENGGMVLRLEPPAGISEVDANSVMGDGSFSSAEPAMQKVNPRVYQMIVVLE